MGIEYSAVKTKKPEAWYIGKDYYGLTDLFPCTAGKETGILGLFPVPKLKDLPHIVGSRHRIVDNTVFQITDYYRDPATMIAKAEELKQRTLDAHERRMFEGLFAWAGSDPLQLIAEFSSLESRDAADEYQLCAAPQDYRLRDEAAE